MQLISRKLITIITEAVLEKEIVAVLDQLQAPGYTIIDARGKGHRGVRTSGWEHGANICVEIICETTLAERIVDELKKRFVENYAMMIFMTDVTVVV